MPVKKSDVNHKYTDAEKVAERLRVLAYVIDHLRAVVPSCGSRQANAAPNRVCGPFANTYEPLVRKLWEAIAEELPGLTFTIEDHYMSPTLNRTMVASWHGGTYTIARVDGSESEMRGWGVKGATAKKGATREVQQRLL